MQRFKGETTAQFEARKQGIPSVTIEPKIAKIAKAIEKVSETPESVPVVVVDSVVPDAEAPKVAGKRGGSKKNEEVA